ncbi:hypothetical protein SeLEV6574_g02862 [Synchytrium endobioticum]|uniref:SH3 domain-containing protein n=1 Tax=Synchytrium endobioticum TaxID=286115 RepID=A0A507D6V3_9FUNG|nr:hypothetical protein SeLEV6574_g02862 [Synchytrium endobioticum]
MADLLGIRAGETPNITSTLTTASRTLVRIATLKGFPSPSPFHSTSPTPTKPTNAINAANERAKLGAAIISPAFVQSPSIPSTATFAPASVSQALDPTQSIYNPPAAQVTYPAITLDNANTSNVQPNNVLLNTILGSVGAIFLLLLIAIAIRFGTLGKQVSPKSPYLGKPGPSVFVSNTPLMSRNRVSPPAMPYTATGLSQRPYRGPEHLRSDLSEISIHSSSNNSSLARYQMYNAPSTALQIPSVPQLPPMYMMNPNANQAPNVLPNYASNRVAETGPRRQSLNVPQPTMAGSGSPGGDNNFLLVYTGIVHSKYVAAQSDELSMDVGQSVQIYCLYEDGWCFGKIQERMGFMPMNFLVFSNLS